MYPKLENDFFLKIKPDRYELYSPTKMPECNLIINLTTFDILSLCNGQNNINEIVNILFDKYDESKEEIENNVLSFLDGCAKGGVISYSTKATCNRQNYIKGDSQIYYPDVISWEITDFCPLNCVHCYLKEKNKNALNMKEINKMLEIISKCGIRMIQITGGDPLTHPHLEYILKSLTNMKIPIVLLTSGTQYTKEIFETLNILKTISNSAVRVSLDGIGSRHNSIRRNPMAFTNTVNFIKRLKEMSIPCQVAATAINQSEVELESLVSLVKSLGVYYMEIGLLVEEGNADQNKLKATYNGNDLSVILNRLNEKYADNTFQLKKYLDENDVARKCGAGTQIIHIANNLDVKPCPIMDIMVGSIREESFEKIMIKSANLFNKITPPNIEICGECEFESDCKGCITQAFSKHKFLNEGCKWCEKYKSCFSR